MYTQEITRRHRAAFIIAIDRSGSMQELVHFGKTVLKKSEAVAYTANTLISELIDRCRRTDGMRNYYDMAFWVTATTRWRHCSTLRDSSR